MNFPNGFDSWYETHHEMVAAVYRHGDHHVVASVAEQVGTGGLYDLAKDWTDQFEKQYEGEMWGEEKLFFDELELFIDSKLNVPV